MHGDIILYQQRSQQGLFPENGGGGVQNMAGEEPETDPGRIRRTQREEGHVLSCHTY